MLTISIELLLYVHRDELEARGRNQQNDARFHQVCRDVACTQRVAFIQSSLRGAMSLIRVGVWLINNCY